MARKRRRSKAQSVAICTLILIVCCCGLPWLLPGCRLDTSPLCATSHDVLPRADEDAGDDANELDAGLVLDLQQPTGLLQR